MGNLSFTGDVPVEITPVRFELDRRADGRWLLRDVSGLGGAVFRSREAALHYALIESGGVAGTVIERRQKPQDDGAPGRSAQEKALW